MKTRTCAAGTLLAFLALYGCATTNNAPPKTAQQPPGCLTYTGSRLPDPDTHCTGNGRSYSQTDIEQTGKTTTAGALRMLDPSLTISH